MFLDPSAALRQTDAGKPPEPKEPEMDDFTKAQKLLETYWTLLSGMAAWHILHGVLKAYYVSYTWLKAWLITEITVIYFTN